MARDQAGRPASLTGLGIPTRRLQAAQAAALRTPPLPAQDASLLASRLAYLAGPRGAVAGINDRHPFTGRTALYEAVSLNDLPMARRLLERGAGAGVAAERAGPPLLYAAACGFTDMAALLLESGVRGAGAR